MGFSDEVQFSGQEWRWLQKVSKSPNELTEDAMRIVEVSVIPVEGGDEEHPLITMTGFLVNPNLLTQQNQRSGSNDPSGSGTTP